MNSLTLSAVLLVSYFVAAECQSGYGGAGYRGGLGCGGGLAGYGGGLGACGSGYGGCGSNNEGMIDYGYGSSSGVEQCGANEFGSEYGMATSNNIYGNYLDDNSFCAYNDECSNLEVNECYDECTSKTGSKSICQNSASSNMVDSESVLAQNSGYNAAEAITDSEYGANSNCYEEEQCCSADMLEEDCNSCGNSGCNLGCNLGCSGGLYY